MGPPPSSVTTRCEPDALDSPLAGIFTSRGPDDHNNKMTWQRGYIDDSCETGVYS